MKWVHLGLGLTWVVGAGFALMAAVMNDSKEMWFIMGIVTVVCSMNACRHFESSVSGGK